MDGTRFFCLRRSAARRALRRRCRRARLKRDDRLACERHRLFASVDVGKDRASAACIYFRYRTAHALERRLWRATVLHDGGDVECTAAICFDVTGTLTDRLRVRARAYGTDERGGGERSRAAPTEIKEGRSVHGVAVQRSIASRHGAPGSSIAVAKHRVVHSFRAQACGYPEHRRANALMRNVFRPSCEMRA